MWAGLEYVFQWRNNKEKNKMISSSYDLSAFDIIFSLVSLS